MKTAISFFILFCCFQVNAFMIDVNLDNFSSTLSTSKDSQSSNLFGSIGFLADLSKSDNARLNFGWSVMSASLKTEVTGASLESFSSLDMGPAIRWTMDQKKLYSLTLVYGIYGKGKYETATTTENITGSSTFVKFSIEPQLTEVLNFGFALNYYSAQYNLSVANSIESSVSYKSSWIFPSLSMAFRY